MNILFVRLSSLGDVAMAIIVIKKFAISNKDMKVFFLSSSRFSDLINSQLPEVKFIPYNKKRNKIWDFLYLICLSLKIRFEYRINRVIDLHSSIRSVVLCLFFTQVFKIKKKDIREKRKEFVKNYSKSKEVPKHIIEQYADVIRDMGIEIKLYYNRERQKMQISKNIEKFTGKKDKKWIGIAPFAHFESKEYPMDRVRELIKMIRDNHRVKIFVFGARKERQKEQIKGLLGDDVIDINMGLSDELAIISNLEFMVSMDSANMHLASLVGTKVISIWLSTHPDTGFYGYAQDRGDAIFESRARELSIYGKIKADKKEEHIPKVKKVYELLSKYLRA